MSRETVEILTDDLDGKKADSTVEFMLDGAWYELELSAKNKQGFLEMARPYMENGRKTSGTRSVTAPGTAPRQRTRATREFSQRVRDWAEREGLDISDRGRIPRKIVAQYEIATKDYEAAQ